MAAQQEDQRLVANAAIVDTGTALGISRREEQAEGILAAAPARPPPGDDLVHQGVDADRHNRRRPARGRGQRRGQARGAIGFSSFAVLTYYAIANASAWTLPAEQRRWPRWLAAAGVIGCVVLAFTLPTASVVGGAAVLGTGALIWLARRSASQSRPAG